MTEGHNACAPPGAERGSRLSVCWAYPPPLTDASMTEFSLSTPDTLGSAKPMTSAQPMFAPRSVSRCSEAGAGGGVWVIGMAPRRSSRRLTPGHESALGCCHASANLDRHASFCRGHLDPSERPQTSSSLIAPIWPNLQDLFRASFSLRLLLSPFLALSLDLHSSPESDAPGVTTAVRLFELRPDSAPRFFSPQASTAALTPLASLSWRRIPRPALVEQQVPTHGLAQPNVSRLAGLYGKKAGRVVGDDPVPVPEAAAACPHSGWPSRPSVSTTQERHPGGSIRPFLAAGQVTSNLSTRPS